MKRELLIRFLVFFASAVTTNTVTVSSQAHAAWMKFPGYLCAPVGATYREGPDYGGITSEDTGMDPQTITMLYCPVVEDRLAKSAITTVRLYGFDGTVAGGAGVTAQACIDYGLVHSGSCQTPTSSYGANFGYVLTPTLGNLWVNASGTDAAYLYVTIWSKVYWDTYATTLAGYYVGDTY